MKFHLREMLGGDLLESVETTTGTLIRIPKLFTSKQNGKRNKEDVLEIPD